MAGHYRRKVSRRQQIYDRILRYMGGRCQRCGYDRCSKALELHHIDPDKKEFSIANRVDTNWPVLRAEIDKCVLLCSNCHRELHDGLWGVS